MADHVALFFVNISQKITYSPQMTIFAEKKLHVINKEYINTVFKSRHCFCKFSYFNYMYLTHLTVL